MKNNIRLYPWFKATTSAMGWLPVFFLYFSEYLSLREVLLLEAVYYTSVVLLEVPSGYFSDTLGRKKTLLISVVMFCVSYGIFLIGDSFFLFAIAQICLAAGIAFQSGTDTVFHYESLLAAGQKETYGPKEARASRISLFTSGGVVFLGGWLGSYNLAWAYAISLVGSLVGVFIVLLFEEPDNAERSEANRKAFFPQLKACVAYLKNGTLAWLFAFWLLLYVLLHVPYEFYQPYLKLLEGEGRLGSSSAPFISGVVFALTRFVSSYFAGISIQVRDKIGLRPLLIISFIFQLVIIGTLAFALHPAIVVIVIFRNLSYDLVAVPINVVVTPLIASEQRATYFSIQSLVSRLGFSLSLLVASVLVEPGEVISWSALSSILWLFFAAGLAGLGVLTFFMKKLKI